MPTLHSYLHKLEFEDRILLVRVKNITYSDNFIEGSFTVGSFDNDYFDIEHCIGNPFDKFPILHFRKQHRIKITNLSKNVDDNWSSYECDFSTYVEADTEINLDDLLEFVDGANLFSLEEEAIKLIDKYKDYIPSVDCPTPSYTGSYADDLAAVLAGTKPVAMFEEIELKEPLVIFLCVECTARGMKLETVDNHNKKKFIIIGDSYCVKSIVDTVKLSVVANVSANYYYWKVGNLLGYPDEYLDIMIEKNYGFNLL